MPGWLYATMLFLFMAINFTDKAVFGQVALPIMRDLGLTHSQFGLLGASFYALFAVGGVVGGSLADHVSTRWLLGGMAFVWSLSLLPVAVGASVGLLLTSRIALGFAEGPAYPVTLVAAYEQFPDKRRAIPTAMIDAGAMVGLGFIAPAVVIGIAGDSWRLALLAPAAVGLVWCVAWFMLPAGPGAAARRAVADRYSRPWQIRGLIVDRTIVGVLLCGFAATWLLTLALIWLPGYLREAFGFAPAAVARIMAGTAIAQLAVLLGVCAFSQHLGLRGFSSRTARGWPAALSLAAAGLLTIALAHSRGVWLPAVLAIAAFSTNWVIFALGPVLVAEVAPPARRGATLGIVNAIATLAGPLAPATMGWVVDASATIQTGYRLGFTLTGALVAVAGLAGLLLLDPGHESRSRALTAKRTGRLTTGAK